MTTPSSSQSSFSYKTAVESPNEQYRIKLEWEISLLRQQLAEYQRCAFDYERVRTDRMAPLPSSILQISNQITGDMDHIEIAVNSTMPEFLMYTEDPNEHTRAPTTASFPTCPMSPFSFYDNPENHDRPPIPSFFSLDGSSRQSNWTTSGTSDTFLTLLTKFPAVPTRTFFQPDLSPIASLSDGTSEPAITGTGSARDIRRLVGRRSHEQYEPANSTRVYHWFTRSYRLNSINVSPSPDGRMTKETFPWPTDMNITEFLPMLECALTPHVTKCTSWSQLPASCSICLAKINVVNFMMPYLHTGESPLDVRDRWNPNEEWIAMAIVPEDQLFVLRGMQLVHGCVLDIIRDLGIEDSQENNSDFIPQQCWH